MKSHRSEGSAISIVINNNTNIGAMVNIDDDDVKEIEALIGCSSAEARHYLEICNGDVEDAAKHVLKNGRDDDWRMKNEDEVSLEV